MWMLNVLNLWQWATLTTLCCDEWRQKTGCTHSLGLGSRRKYAYLWRHPTSLKHDAWYAEGSVCANNHVDLVRHVDTVPACNEQAATAPQHTPCQHSSVHRDRERERERSMNLVGNRWTSPVVPWCDLSHEGEPELICQLQCCILQISVEINQQNRLFFVTLCPAVSAVILIQLEI